MRRGLFGSIALALLGMIGSSVVSVSGPATGDSPRLERVPHTAPEGTTQKLANVELRAQAQSRKRTPVRITYRHRTPMKHRGAGERAHRNWRFKRRAGRA